MKIKEVQQLVEMSAANIRYYEKEGLLHPERNEENNYREYTQKDVNRLEEIKKFRLLGISITSIQKLYAKELTLDEVMRERLQELEEERRNLELVKSVCQNALEQHMDMDSLKELQIDEKNEDWQRRLAVIMKEDTVQEIITQKQFNFHVALMLVWGYLLCAVASLLYQNILMEAGHAYREAYAAAGGRVQNIPFPWSLWVLGAIVLLMTIVTEWTSNMIIQLISFHLSAVAQSLFLMLFFVQSFAVPCHWFVKIWIGLALYVAILYGVYCRRQTLFNKIKHILPVWGLFTMLWAALIFAMGGTGPASGIVFVFITVLSLAIGIRWHHFNTDTKSYNRYYAVESSAKLVNVLGAVFAGLGYYGAGNVFRR